MLGKNFSSVVKYFSYFFQELGIDISCKLLDVQIIFSGKNKKNVINLLSAEFAWRVVKVSFENCYG